MKKTFFLLLISLPASALEVVSQNVLCERFVTEAEKSQCLKFFKDKQPDTYVSSMCQDIFEDKVFFECLNFAAKNTVDPRKLDSCSTENASDVERMNCLKKVAKKENRGFQRLPASIPKRK